MTVPRSATIDSARREGIPIAGYPEPDLLTDPRKRARALLRRATGFAQHDTDTHPRPEALAELIDDALTGLRGRLGSASTHDAAEFAALAVDLARVRIELGEQDRVRRSHAVLDVQRALARLRGIGSTAKMLEQAPRALCEFCGFTAAILFRVQDGVVQPAAAHSTTDAGMAAKVRRHFAEIGPVELDGLTLEIDMLRRRTPVMVHDAMNDPRTRHDLTRVSSVDSYVAAPIVPEGRVIGFLHAMTAREVDVVDRDVLWAFAEGYGYALERTILLERLHEQGERVRGLVHATEVALTDIREAGLQISTGDPEAGTPGAQPVRAAAFSAPDSRIHELLTPRELEIMEFMAHGETNRRIAEHMVVSEATVKTHVSRILKKLRAANRAEAVSRFMRMTARPESHAAG
ncbi:LuxR C-terminal-related transcriptional regulator [Nocardia inohanensis]|uniref:LuxR C-terminal-related transcriptional regulator n=1 Tax=Nocardia inohanensis TaxID=209246 RepID=UPI0008365FA0|nr:LuxR C-terminal-related transcriptional regulator [Nocardia inohanensis]